MRKARGPEKNQAWYGGNNEGPGRDSEKKVLLACWRLLVCQEQRGAVALGPQSLPHPYNGLSKCQGWGSLVQLPHCTAGPRLHVLHLHGETRTNAGRTNSSYTLWALSVLFPAPQGTLPLPQPSSHKSDFIPNPKGQGGLQEMAHEISIFVSLALESSSYSTGDLALHMHSMLLLNPLEHHICLKYIFFLARAHTISFCCVLHPETDFTPTVLGILYEYRDLPFLHLLQVEPFSSSQSSRFVFQLQCCRTFRQMGGWCGDSSSPKALEGVRMHKQQEERNTESNSKSFGAQKMMGMLLGRKGLH